VRIELARSLGPDGLFLRLQEAWQTNPALVEHFALCITQPPINGRFIVYFANSSVTGWDETQSHKEQDFSSLKE
jgi:hypothetical protein